MPSPLVSIPFIAGQWSLLDVAKHVDERTLVSQSPSLRGSGRFPSMLMIPQRRLRVSQSPSLRGSGRFTGGGVRRRLRRPVSIPFIAGQWSLLAGVAAADA